MARRLISHKLIRQVHMYSAFTVMTFLLMYFITGFLLIRPGWFSSEISETQEKVHSVRIPENLTAQEVAGAIQDSLEIGGKRERAWTDEEGILRFEFSSPGKVHSVTVDPESQEAVVNSRALNTFQTITTFHRLHNYTGPFLYDMFILMMDAASFALILFVISGVILWLSVLKTKLWGVLALGAGFGYTLWVILSFMFG